MSDKYIKLEDAIKAIGETAYFKEDRQIVEDGARAALEELDAITSCEVIAHFDEEQIQEIVNEALSGFVSEDCIYVDKGKKIERAISWLMQSGIQATFHDKDTKRAVNDLIHAFKSALSVIPSRPRGEWIRDPENQGGFTPGGNAVMSCSCCGWIYGAHRIFPDYNYCPNCGAKMKGDK